MNLDRIRIRDWALGTVSIPYFIYSSQYDCHNTKRQRRGNGCTAFNGVIQEKGERA